MEMQKLHTSIKYFMNSYLYLSHKAFTELKTILAQYEMQGQ